MYSLAEIEGPLQVGYESKAKAEFFTSSISLYVFLPSKTTIESSIHKIER